MAADPHPSTDATAGRPRRAPAWSKLFPARSLAELDALLPDLATGLRAATATVVPLALSLEGGGPELSWMALGGWLGTLADPGGSRAARARTVLVFTVLGSLVVALGQRGPSSIGAGAILVGAVAFLASMLRVLGGSVATLGALITIVAALANASHATEPLRAALGFAEGSAFAALLSSMVWPVWTHLSVRRAVAAVFRELEAYAAGLRACVDAGAPRDDARWTALARTNTPRIRDAIEGARAAAVAVRARRSGETALGANLRLLVGSAESQFLSMVTLASQLEDAAPAARASITPALDSLARAYGDVARNLVRRAWSPQVASSEGSPLALAADDPLGSLAAELERESRAARRVAGALDRVEARPPEMAAGRGAASATLAVDWTIVRDALASGSPVLHHAIRVAVASAVSVVVGRLLSPQHAPWVTITAVVVLQPDAGATVRRAAERVVGTVLGGLTAVAIAALSLGPAETALVMFPLSVAAIVTRPRSYRLFTFFLTPVFVLVTMRAPGGWWVAVARAGDTLLGGALALVASMVFWPRWEERVALPDALAAMVAAVESYAGKVVGTLSARDAATLGAIAEARLGAAAALARAEQSVERLLENPLAGTDRARAVDLVTYARRLALAVTTLDTLTARGAAGRPAPVEAAVERVRRFEALLQARNVGSKPVADGR